MDFCELFDYIKDLSKSHKIPDSVIFKSIVRSKRELLNMNIKGGKIDDCDYFAGYRLVDDMDDDMRTDILKYNIGPNHINEISSIKNFLKVNNFQSLI
jgi:hypothetical protein